MCNRFVKWTFWHSSRNDKINHIEEEVGALLWIARVPTKSNISDDPSRGDSAALTSLGAIRDHP